MGEAAGVAEGPKFSTEWGGGDGHGAELRAPPGRRKGGRHRRSGREGPGLEPAKRDAAESSRSRGRKEGRVSPRDARRPWSRIELRVSLLSRGGGAPRSRAPGPRGALWPAGCRCAGAEASPTAAGPGRAGTERHRRGAAGGGWVRGAPSYLCFNLFFLGEGGFSFFLRCCIFALRLGT